MKSSTIAAVAGCVLLACGLALGQTPPPLAPSAPSPVKALGNFSHIVAVAGGRV